MPTDFPFWFQVFLEFITLFFMLVGLMGLIVPVFPGLTVMWLATLIYAFVQWMGGLMTWVDWLLFALVTLLMIGGNIADNIIIAAKMRGHEIPWRAILLCYFVGIVVSLFLTPLVGLIASPLALLGLEYLRFRDWKQARESARVFLIGWGASFAARLGIGILMVIFWMLWAWL
jgi:uncharacterized protein YqgC (DUF456 family)